MGFYPRKPNVGAVLQTDAGSRVTTLERLVAHYTFEPNTVSNTAVHAAIALTSGAQAGYTGGTFTNPDVPRNVIVKGNASGNAGNVVVYGSDFRGNAISETIALNGSSAVEGAIAFKKVTSLDLPAETHGGTDTVSIGYGSTLGLPYKLTRNTISQVFFNDVPEETATVTVDPTDISLNTIRLDSTLNTGDPVDLYLFV